MGVSVSRFASAANPHFPPCAAGSAGICRRQGSRSGCSLPGGGDGRKHVLIGFHPALLIQGSVTIGPVHGVIPARPYVRLRGIWVRPSTPSWDSACGPEVGLRFSWVGSRSLESSWHTPPRSHSNSLKRVASATLTPNSVAPPTGRGGGGASGGERRGRRWPCRSPCSTSSSPASRRCTGLRSSRPPGDPPWSAAKLVLSSWAVAEGVMVTAASCRSVSVCSYDL